MHAPSAGPDPHAGADHVDVVLDVFDWLEARIAEVEAAGVARERIAFDPGLGFGKTLAQNLAILNALDLYQASGRTADAGRQPQAHDRRAGRRGGGRPAGWAARSRWRRWRWRRGVQMLRVHDVARDGAGGARLARRPARRGTDGDGLSGNA